MANLFDNLPSSIPQEIVSTLAESSQVRIERIVSTGHTTPEEDWYDQDEHEWVAVLKGDAIITYDDGTSIHLGLGDHLMIPAHQRHRVQWTSLDEPTVWLAVFFR